MRDISALDEPPSVAELAKDEIYANDVNTLAVILAERLQPATFGPNSSLLAADVFMALARALRNPLSTDVALVAMVEDHGMIGLLTALKRAYQQPVPDTSDIVEHE